MSALKKKKSQYFLKLRVSIFLNDASVLLLKAVSAHFF